MLFGEVDIISCGSTPSTQESCRRNSIGSHNSCLRRVTKKL